MKKTTIKVKTLCALALSVMFTGQSFAGTVLPEFSAKPLELNAAKANADKILDGKFSSYELYDLDLTSFTGLLASNPNKETEVRLNLGNHQWTMNLKENQIKSPNMIIRSLTNEGILETPSDVNIRTYAGFNNGDIDQSVRLTTYFETVIGTINDRYGKFVIEPLSRYDEKASKTQFIIFKPENVLAKILPCGNPSSESEILYSSTRLANTKSAVIPCYSIDMCVAIDFLAYKKFGTNAPTQKVELEMLNVINLMNEIYSGVKNSPTPTNITFKLVEVFVETTDNDLFKSKSQNGADKMLTALNEWVKTPAGFKSKYGLATLWTGRGAYGDGNDFRTTSPSGTPINGVEYGLGPNKNGDGGLAPNVAFPNTTPTKDGAPHNIVKWGYFDSWGSAVIQAHETGHNFSCPHNGPASNLMTNGPSPFAWGFSATDYSLIEDNIVKAKAYPTLLKGCDESVSAPIANFITYNGGSTTGTSCFGNVAFVNRSAGASTWEWDFGDGSAKSTERDPIYKYTKTGVFTVTLKAMSGSQTTTKTSNIVVNNISNSNKLDSLGVMLTRNTMKPNGANDKIMYFNVSRPTLLKSVLVPVYGVTSGTMTIEIYDANLICIFKKVANVNGSLTHDCTKANACLTGTNTVEYSKTPTTNLIILDAELPKGDGYSIGIGKTTPGLYAMRLYNSLPLSAVPPANLWPSKDIGYPFSNKNTGTPLITITKNNAPIFTNPSKTPPPNINDPSTLDRDDVFYYYFYNWRVQELTCNTDPTANSIFENNLNNSFSVYPNPVNGNQVNVEFTQTLNNAKIELLNVLGQVVFSKSLQGVQVGVNTLTLPSDLAKGTYIFKLNSENGTAIQKLIIE